MHKKDILSVFILFLFSLYCFGEGADAAYPTLEKLFIEMQIPEQSVYTVTDRDMATMLDKSVELDINLFELLDCMYRYLAPQNKRFEISGTVLRNAQRSFSYGDPIESLLPIKNLITLQIGACFTKEQKPLDMKLNASYSTYVKVATAIYDTECGFGKLVPFNFLEPYGMHIKKWGIVKSLNKIYLYGPGTAAMYADGLSRPKRWYVDSVTRITEIK